MSIAVVASEFANVICYRAFPSRGAPFETEIGVGKVIKGWDEGMSCFSLSTALCLPLIDGRIDGMLGVPQLSLGEKAVLTATPDYVRSSFPWI